MCEVYVYSCVLYIYRWREGEREKGREWVKREWGESGRERDGERKGEVGRERGEGKEREREGGKGEIKRTGKMLVLLFIHSNSKLTKLLFTIH